MTFDDNYTQPSLRELAGKLGLRKVGNVWRGKCPYCGYHGETLVVSERRGLVRVCCHGACDQRELWSHVLGRPAARMPTRATLCRADAMEPSADEKARNRARALRLWAGAVHPEGTPVAAYLTRRGLPELIGSAVIRYREDAPHPCGGRRPAMIALVQDVAGDPIAVHQTFLTQDGAKAPVEPPKSTLGPYSGGAIRLSGWRAGAPLVIGEGIETSASAGRVLDLPAWAAISAGNLAHGMVLPTEIRRVMIAEDHDPINQNGKQPGAEAANRAARRWRAEGREVQIAKPDREGHDFNDLLLENHRA